MCTTQHYNSLLPCVVLKLTRDLNNDLNSLALPLDLYQSTTRLSQDTKFNSILSHSLSFVSDSLRDFFFCARCSLAHEREIPDLVSLGQGRGWRLCCYHAAAASPFTALLQPSAAKSLGQAQGFICLFVCVCVCFFFFNL